MQTYCTRCFAVVMGAASLSVMSGPIWAVVQPELPAAARRTTGIQLMLAPATQTIKGTEAPRFSAKLTNRGKESVVLVDPGDGSECGWRTPLIEWLPRPAGRVGRCGNINALRPGEIFTLKPGEARVLNDWIGRPHLPGPGRHRARLRYTNEPARKWKGLPLGKHDPKAMNAVRHSTAVTVVSNTVEVVVEP